MPSRRLRARETTLQSSIAGWRGSDYAKPNAAASKTTASDRRARGDGGIDTLTEANRSVLAAQCGEAAKEHGGDVFGWWTWRRWEVLRVDVGGENGEITPTYIKNLFYLAKLG